MENVNENQEKLNAASANLKTHETDKAFSRRSFLQVAGLSAVALGLQQVSCSAPKQVVQKPASGDATPKIAGFEKVATDNNASKGWVPVSDRKIRVGLVGYGVCKFAAQFGFQDHPNVEIAAVSDLFPDRCAELAQVTNCKKTYPSLEELVKDDTIEAVFIATDAPSHGRHAILALNHGKHVACAVPAVVNSLEEAQLLYETVKRTGKKYMMFETSAYHHDVHEMRELFKLGALGKVLYTEGEYYHYFEDVLDGYLNWREGFPPQWYGTHSNAYHMCITDGSFTEVSCLGLPSRFRQYQAAHNAYKNPFGTEIAMFRTSEGGASRMSVSWDTPGFQGEMGRLRAEKGSYNLSYQGSASFDPGAIAKPALPPGMEFGAHGGSHGLLTNEFVTAILQDRRPLVHIAMSLNLTVPGILAHQSALKGGEWLKIPQYATI